MESCIFCKIVSGTIPSFKLYEDDLFMGFLDIYPRSAGHTLIIPKQHHRWVYDVPEFTEYWSAALQVTRKLQQTLKPKYISYLTLGLQVPHAHIHVIPRYEASEAMPAAAKGDADALQEVFEKITRDS